MEKTIQQVSKEMLDNFKQKERKDKSKFYCNKKEIDWQKDIIYKAHLNRMPNDDMYKRIYFMLDSFANTDEDYDKDSIQETIYEIESDCYTADLTNWLHDNINNVYYLTEALEEMEIKNGFQLLQAAQQKYIQEIGTALLEAIAEYVENN